MSRRRWTRPGGCDFAADPALPADTAQVYWRADEAPAVVTLLAPAPLTVGSTLTLFGLRSVASREAAEGLHLRLAGDGQLLVLGNPAPDAPLALMLPIDAQAHTRWRAAVGTLALGPALDPLTPLQRRGHRLALQAFDGRQSGASDREIASVLFETTAVPRGAAWKADHLRAQTLRLIDAARRRVAGAYRALLRLEPPRRRRG